MSRKEESELTALVRRANKGDSRARQELISRSCERLVRLTRVLFRDFQRLRRFEDSCDVVQVAAIRLLRRLEAVRVESVDAFFQLAAREIRFVLLDLSRHYFGPQGQATNQATVQDPDLTSFSRDVAEQSSSYDPSCLAFWTEFHQKVEALPTKERVVFDLLWYHGMTQEEAASVLNLSLATVKRYWVEARLRLKDFVQGYPDEG